MLKSLRPTHKIGHLLVGSPLNLYVTLLFNATSCICINVHYIMTIKKKNNHYFIGLLIFSQYLNVIIFLCSSYMVLSTNETYDQIECCFPLDFFSPVQCSFKTFHPWLAIQPGINYYNYQTMPILFTYKKVAVRRNIKNISKVLIIGSLSDVSVYSLLQEIELRTLPKSKIYFRRDDKQIDFSQPLIAMNIINNSQYKIYVKTITK